MRRGDGGVERFLAELAHDLRNLLEGMDVTVLAKPGVEPEMRDVTHRELYGLIRKTETYVDRKRLAERRIELRTAAVALPPLCREAVEKLAPFLRTRNVSAAFGTETAVVAADRGSVEKLVATLLHGAATLTAEGDAVELSHRRRGAETLLEVRIPGGAESLARAKRLLTLEDDSGVGLGVAREIARLQGGDLTCEAEGVPEESLSLVLSLPAAAGETRVEGTLPREGRRAVLVVDDNGDAARSLALLIAVAGHDAAVELDGRSALEAVRERRPDVVLLDLGLPDLDGYEVCRILRRTGGSPRIVLVAVSGRGDDEARKLAREAGFDAHLLKPVDRAELLRVLALS